ncbi:MAG TPA: hypothetical protein ENN84_01120 [Candidatus Marinimicrobia bacterium]|nr:hypothetical protein [Candidatus Neomarinimicrobiota bacterium]
MIAGLNASWFELNDDFLIEPRLSANFQANRQNRFSIGFGMHSQIEPLFVYFVSQAQPDGETHFPNRSLKRMRAKHFVFAYDFLPTAYLRLKIEPYYQHLYNVPVLDGEAYSMLNFQKDWCFDKALVNKGTGENYGIDLTLERYLNEGYYYLITASLYQSNYIGGDGQSYNSRYNGNAVINFLGGKEWTIGGKNLLGINGKIAFYGPYWHQAIDINASAQRGDIVYDEAAPFTYRPANLESISDITLSYRINHSRASSLIAFQIKNILGRQYLGKKYNLATQEIENDFFTSPVPFISYKIEF